MSKATKPKTGWDIYQKIRQKISTTGDDICSEMKTMADDCMLEIVGSDSDCGYLYKLTK
jgi:hypothetical protein